MTKTREPRRDKTFVEPLQELADQTGTTVTVEHNGRSATIRPEGPVDEAKRMLTEVVTTMVSEHLDEDDAIADAETGEVVGRKVLRWIDLPAHLDRGSWKRANGGLEVVVPAETDDNRVTGVTAACLVEVSGVELGEAVINGGSWRRDPDDPEGLIYKFNLTFAAVEGPLVLARLAGLAAKDELRGMLRLGVRHQQIGLDLPDGSEVSLTAKADEDAVPLVDSEGAKPVGPGAYDYEDEGLGGT